MYIYNSYVGRGRTLAPRIDQYQARDGLPSAASAKVLAKKKGRAHCSELQEMKIDEVTPPHPLFHPRLSLKPRAGRGVRRTRRPHR